MKSYRFSNLKVHLDTGPDAYKVSNLTDCDLIEPFGFGGVLKLAS